jgi:hypothetical protein
MHYRNTTPESWDGGDPVDPPVMHNQWPHLTIDTAYWISCGRAFIFANGNGEPADADAARRAAERVGRLAPPSAEARLALGLYYGVVLKDFKRAVSEYEAGLRVARNDPDLLSFAGGTEALLGSWDSAEVHLQRVQTLDPRSATTALVRANTLLARRRYAEAVEATARVIALAPANPLGVGFTVLSRLGQGDSAAARAAIRAKPNELDEGALVSILGGWGLAWLLSDAQLDRLLNLTPAHFDDDRAAWWDTRAEAFRQRGDSVQARMCDDSTVPRPRPTSEDRRRLGRDIGTRNSTQRSASPTLTSEGPTRLSGRASAPLRCFRWPRTRSKVLTSSWPSPGSTSPWAARAGAGSARVLAAHPIRAVTGLAPD